MRRATLRQRLRYRFDNTISRGTASVIAYLAVITAALIVVAGLVLALSNIDTGDGSVSTVEGVWLSLLRTLDPGTMGGDQGWAFRIVALGVTLGGLFIVSALIGLITTGIEGKIDEIRKGRTPVLEEGHTLILGWSQKLFTIIAELATARESEARSTIVVLAPHDKVTMEDEIRDRVDHRKTRIVCRTGDPTSPNDLDMVNVMASKAVIVLAAPEESPDAQVIKTVLALMRHDPGLERLRVVAELTEAQNATAVKATAGGRITTVVSSDVIARITAQVCRQSGLSFVYQDLLDFEGDEIYFHDEPALAGMTFGQALFAYADCSVIGLRKHDGRIVLAGPMDEPIERGDSAILIAADDAAIRYAPVEEGGAPLPAVRDTEAAAESLLIIGWNPLALSVLLRLDAAVPPGSRLTLAYDPAYVRDHEVALGPFTNLEVSLRQADTTNADSLTDIVRAARYDHVVIVCYRHGLAPEEAEARALLTLVQLRRLTAEAGWDRANIVTELLDVRDVDLARVADPDDYIVSESLSSLLLAQLAENPELLAVFDDLFDADGAEITLRPADRYLPAGETFAFADAVAAARAQGEVAIGYRRDRANGSGPNVEVRLNPPKRLRLAFSPGDQLIVLSRFDRAGAMAETGAAASAVSRSR